MTHLPPDLQAIVDAATHDGDGWALPDDAAPPLINQLIASDLARHRGGRPELTPQGFAHTARFKAIGSGGGTTGGLSSKPGSSAR